MLFLRLFLTCSFVSPDGIIGGVTGLGISREIGYHLPYWIHCNTSLIIRYAAMEITAIGRNQGIIHRMSVKSADNKKMELTGFNLLNELVRRQSFLIEE